MRRTLLVAIGAIVMAGAAVPAAALASPATVTSECTQFGTVILPQNAPPPKQGLITVVVKGQIVTTEAVPGPCAAPGFVKLAGGG